MVDKKNSHKKMRYFFSVIFIALLAGCSSKDNDTDKNVSSGVIDRANTGSNVGSGSVDRSDTSSPGSDSVRRTEGSVSNDAVNQYTVGGVVTGLKGVVVIQNNGADKLTIKENGKFRFATVVEEGAPISVTVLTHPGKPSQKCSVANGQASVSGANITNVAIDCETDTFSVGGTAAGIKDEVILRNNGKDDLKVTTDGVFTFNKPVADGQAYKVSIQGSSSVQSCDLTQNSGVISSAHVSGIILKCVKKNIISKNPVNRHVAMDSRANAVIVWQQFDGKFNHVYMSEYRNGVWTHPKGKNDHISPSRPSVTSAINPQLAVDNNGNALIVWQQSDGKQSQIFMSEYRKGKWNHPDSLSDNISINGQSASNAQVDMDNNGNAVVVWQQSDGKMSRIYKSEYHNGGWRHPDGLSDYTGLLESTTNPATNPQVGLDDNDNMLVVWQQSDGKTSQIYKSEYRNGSWVHPANVADNISFSSHDASRPLVAMDNKGNAVIVWQQSDGNSRRLYKSEHHSGSWGQPGGALDYTSPEGNEELFPDVALDVDGRPKITWQKSSETEGEGFTGLSR